MEDIIKDLLTKKRYEHSMGVAVMAKELAERLGADPDKAYLAGVVHDIAKELNPSELYDYCERNGIEISQIEKNNPQLLHAPAGARMLRSYGICDDDIENAVRYHTVGREGMSLLERIIYLADMLEPSRSFEGVEELRELCDKDFEAAFLMTLRRSIEWNLEKGCLIHEGTLKAWNDRISAGGDSK